MRDKEKRSAGRAQMRKEIICLRQIASGTQSCQAPQRVRGWGVEVGLPTLFFFLCYFSIPFKSAAKLPSGMGL